MGSTLPSHNKASNHRQELHSMHAGSRTVQCLSSTAVIPKVTLLCWKTCMSRLCMHLWMSRMISKPLTEPLCLSTIVESKQVVKMLPLPKRCSSTSHVCLSVCAFVSVHQKSLAAPGEPPMPSKSSGCCTATPTPQESGIASGPSQESETCRQQTWLTAI